MGAVAATDGDARASPLVFEMENLMVTLSRVRASFAVALVLAAGTLVGCASRQPLIIRDYTPQGVAPSDAGARGGYERGVTTSSPAAQEWFSRGLFFCFAFDHEQADVAFKMALEYDPNMAMAYWGIAYAAGPNINNIMMDDARNRAASEAIATAKAMQANCSPVERALIAALDKRYADPPPADRRALDEAYADAMRGVHAQHAADADVAAIFAESLMALYPWDIWSPAGEPRPITLELVGVIERGLALAPDHIGLNHCYIHTMEASLTPGKADAAADRLRNMAPGAPHLVHMPSHIDIRRGRYNAAVIANQRATRVDAERTRRVGPGGFYALYRAHNYHFLQYAAMFEGRKQIALQASRDVVKQIPIEALDAYSLMLEGFIAAPYHAMVRFGMWDEILAEPQPEAKRWVTTATHHYARGIALATLGRVDEARSEQALFEAAFERVPQDSFIANNPSRTVLDIGRAMLAGEIEYRAKNYDRAFEHLRDAVRRDEALKYDEPWGWMQPAAHALGALLLEQGRLTEAEAVYRADLQRHPANGWSLGGLAECLERSGRREEAGAARAMAKQAWARADVPMTTSCYCRRGA
jgi:tetratricopeptide (TPR) repeat protein